MAPSSRDRISVDLRGLRAALFEQAKKTGVSPSDIVRDAIGRALTRNSDPPVGTSERQAPCTDQDERVRLSFRLSRKEEGALVAGARQSGLPVGAYLAALAAGVPFVTGRGAHADHLQALVASNAEMATLCRNVHHLTVLLRQANALPARQYADMLATLERDVRRHLELTAEELKALRPMSDRPASKQSTRTVGRPV